MIKFLIGRKFLVTALICFSSASLCLTAASALAAEESDQLLGRIDILLKEAAAKAVEAGETGDLDRSKAALAQANEAAGLLLGLAYTAQQAGDAALALVALNMASQTASLISDVLAISGRAADGLLVSAAMDAAEQASLLISNIASMAQVTQNVPLAQAALSAANNSKAVIIQVQDTAQVVAQISPDQASVAIAETVAEKSQTVLDLNAQAVSTALATEGISEEGEGFVQEETQSLQEEVPIQDSESGSQI